MLNFCFCIRWDVRVTWCIPVCSSHEMSTQYFSCLGVTCMDLTKVHWNTLHSAFLCIWGVKHRRTISHARVGPVRIWQKARWDTLCQSCVFTSSGFYGSHSVFRCVRGMKRWQTIFHAWVGPVWIHKNRYYFLCSGGTSKDLTKSTSGHVTLNFCVCSGGICGSHSAFRCVRRANRRRTIFHAQVRPVGIWQKRFRTRYDELLLFLSVGSAGDVVHSVHPGLETSMHYFSCSGGTGTDLTICALGHIMPNLFFGIRWDLLVT
jgi:hypothetical protein